MSTTSRTTLLILDCYTVEPSGLGVPPYLSTYARAAYGALRSVQPRARVAYLTIDDVRWCLNGGRPYEQLPLSDRLTYSVTTNREEALRLLGDAALTVVIAGDAVPSVHLQAQNGSVEEIARALACTRGRRVLLGPLASYALADPAGYGGLFDTVHTHTLTSAGLSSGSRQAAPYERLAADRVDYCGLIEQLRWTPIAEIELYRGCTRRRFCDFCNEPVKAPTVDFRPVEDVLAEVAILHAAGVRHFRLGQQTCFFSYMNRDAGAIEKLLAGIRESAAPDLVTLHIDNADPLAVASPSGAKIARLVALYCTEGNCAPMGNRVLRPEGHHAQQPHLHPRHSLARGRAREPGRCARRPRWAERPAPRPEPDLRPARRDPPHPLREPRRADPDPGRRAAVPTASTSGRPAPTPARRSPRSRHRGRFPRPSTSRAGRPTSTTSSTSR
ncbi:hypothetical protein GCM10009733_006590 [Nonomuraea maheshkhaliensis]|uniref:Radical SAM protein n=1 Tax=Nonomuraea maheshkhaliensis TaxID=419590 RepID=A0ABP4QKF0_9ACTN